MARFVHLHVHSHYSLLDSTVKLGDLAKRASKLGMDAMAVTDHGVLFGCIELQTQCAKAGIRPIFGVEVYLQPERPEAASRGRMHHLVLLAETLTGYQNLVRLVSRTWRRERDRRGRPVTLYADLIEHAEGLIALSGDLGGEIPQALLRNDVAGAEAVARRMVEVFGEGNFYLELQRHERVPEQQEVCEALVQLGGRLGIPCVATNNVHYLDREDVDAHAVLMCIGMEKRIDRDVLSRIPLRDLYVKSPEEMEELFADHPEAVANSVLIAERCRVTIPTGGNHLPDYPVPEGHDAASYLAQVAAAGLERRFGEIAATGRAFDRPEYEARLRLELDVIARMNFPGYFLIVWDFIDWAKRQGIPVGPGRGSGAGSLVAWSCGITDLDPLAYGLLFERFLNPERVSMPDFDIDFCQSRRGEVIRYVTQKYGSDQVGQIVTFGQLKAKAVMRDVARVLNLPYADADRLAKLVPDELNIKLTDAFDKEPRLREAVSESETTEFLYRSALALEGNVRNTGMHAAGVVIAGKPLWEYVPVITGAEGDLVTQYAKDDVELAGLVKFDFLGLKTLTVVDDAVKMVNAGRAAGEQLDFSRLPFTEPRVYDLIKTGDTAGVFQMESEGFQRLMRQLKPDCFEDVVAAVALYRPGPLGTGMVEQFIDCKHGRAEVSYPHPWLEPVLKETYGVMVYQEQVMQVAQVLAGYSLGGADLLRRAMGKKKPEEMAKQKEIFVAGAEKKGIASDKAGEIFDQMAHFAGYGFNKSHSAAYAVLTFQTAYLKAIHPREFYAALMTNDADNTDKVVRYIQDARNRGIRVLPPDVNASGQSFSVVADGIRFGLGAVKGAGTGAVEAVLEARASRPFTSLFDFCERVDPRRCGRRVIEALIRCGAFDSVFPEYRVGETAALARVGRWRSRMWASLDAAIDRGQRAQADAAAGQSNLFDMFGGGAPMLAEPTYADSEGWDDKAVLNAEKETIGFYVSGHPLDRYAEEISQLSDTTTAGIEQVADRAEVRVAGVVAALSERPLKSGEGRMALATLEDTTGSLEMVVYAKLYGEIEALLKGDAPLLVRGRVRVDQSGDDFKRTLVCSEVDRLSDVRERKVTVARVEVDSEEVSPELVTRLSQLLGRHPGRCAVSILVRYPRGEAEVKLPPAMGVACSDALVSEVSMLLGRPAVRFR